MANSAKQGEDGPWWHEDATEFEAEAQDAGQDDAGTDSGELLNTATQEAFKLAGTLSTWAEQTGLGDVIRSVAQQAVSTAQDAAGSFSGSSGDDEGDLEDLATEDEAETEDDVDLASTDYAHLDSDPAAAGVVQFNGTAAGASGSSEHGSHGRGEARITCDYCPVCRLIESLDDLNPETAASIAEMMAVLTDGVASAVMELVPKNSGDQ